MTSDEVQAAVTAALQGITDASAEVLHYTGRQWDIRFGGSLNGVDVASATIHLSASTPTVTLSTLAVGETTTTEAVPQRTLVVDYSEGATQLTVANQTADGFTLTLDGAEGEVTEVRGNLELDVFGFALVSGDLAIKSSVQQVTLEDEVRNAQGEVTQPASQVSVNALTFGGSNLKAFVGSGGNYDDSGNLAAGATGVSLTGVNFAFAVLPSV